MIRTMKRQYFPPSPYCIVCGNEYVSIEFDSCEIRDEDVNITLLCHTYDDYEYRINAMRLAVDDCELDKPSDAFFGDDINGSQDTIDIFIKNLYFRDERQFKLEFDLEIERRPVQKDDDYPYWDEDYGFESVGIIKDCELQLTLKEFLLNPEEMFGLSDQAQFYLDAFNQLVQNYQKNRMSILDLVAKTAGDNVKLARDMWYSLMKEFPDVLHSTVYGDFTGTLMLLIVQKHERESLFHLLDDFGTVSDFFVYYDSITTTIFGNGGDLDLWPSIYVGHLIENNDVLKLEAVLLAIRRNQNKRQSLYTILNVALLRGARKSAIRKTPLSLETKKLLTAQEAYMEKADEKLKYKLLLLDIL